VTFATTVFAACVARLESVTSPVAVSEPVMVGLAREGEFDRTTEPVPVDVVAPVPPFAAVSGFCNVSELNVGDGYVWASASDENSPATTIANSFFISSRQ
jgi:hypothetical protein